MSNNITIKEHKSLNHQDHISFIFDGRNGDRCDYDSCEHNLRRLELLMKKRFSLQQEGKKKWLENRELKYEKFFPVEFMNDKDFVLNHIKKYGYGLKFASKQLQDDREFVFKVIQLEPTEFQFASQNIQHDKKVYQLNGLALQYAPKIIKRDRNIVLSVVRQNGEALQWVDDKLKSDKEIVMEAFKQNKKALHLVAVSHLLYMKNSLLLDQEFMLTVVKASFPEFSHLTTVDYSKKAIMRKLVQEYVWLLKFASDGIKNDRDIVLSAIKNYNELRDKEVPFKFASAHLQNDREIALLAVDQDGSALKYVSEKLRRDKQVVLKAVSQNGYYFDYVPDELKNDRDVVLAAVTQDGDALRFASDELRNDREVVLTSVRQKGDALCFASYGMKNDREVVLTAVQTKGKALRYAGEMMKRDKEIVLQAIKQSLEPLEYASQDLLSDKEFMLEVVKCGHEGVFNYFQDLNFTKELVLQAIKLNSLSIGFYSSVCFELPNFSLKYIREDKELIMEAVKNNGYAFHCILAGKLQHDPELVMEALKCNGYVLEYSDELYQARMKYCYHDAYLGMTTMTDH